MSTTHRDWFGLVWLGALFCIDSRTICQRIFYRGDKKQLFLKNKSPLCLYFGDKSRASTRTEYFLQLLKKKFLAFTTTRKCPYAVPKGRVQVTKVRDFFTTKACLTNFAIFLFNEHLGWPLRLILLGCHGNLRSKLLLFHCHFKK